ncbi:hypothetical protein [Microbacterium sp. GCS4]|nr:hypothetical protein [Microbacterium sp. GCS4]
MTDTQHAEPTPGPFASMLAALDRFDAHLAEFQEAAREEVAA